MHICLIPSTPMSLHILLLSDGMFPFVMGGMQKHTFSLCEQLLIKAVRVTLFHAIPKGTVTSENEVRALFSKNSDLLNVKTFEFPNAGKLPGHYVRENILLSQNMFLEYNNSNKEFDLVYAQGFTGNSFVNSEFTNESPVNPCA